MRVQYLLILLLFSLTVGCSLEQKYSAFKNTFEQDIQALEQLRDFEEKEDYLLFIGSSSIRLWENIEQDMAPYTVVKRGYGGAHYYDLIHYVDRLIKNKSAAKAVIIFVANDITGEQSWDTLHHDLKPIEIKRLFKVITKKIQKSLSKNLPVFVIETTPTPKRWAVWKQTSKANDLIERYTEKHPHLFYISTRSFFITKNGIANSKLFLKDSLHLNTTGYKIWSKIIKNELKNSALINNPRNE